MANIFQKMFLSSKKLTELEQKNNIMNLVTSGPVVHHIYETKTGGVSRRFSIKTDECNLYAERNFERSRPFERQVQYSLHVRKPWHISCATHSDVNSLAQVVYTQMYKIWYKNRTKTK